MDVEVRNTFNPEAQCFKPIDNLNIGLTVLSLNDQRQDSGNVFIPLFKSSQQTNNQASSSKFINSQQQEPITFTTATFAQTKFGSTKLKNIAKRTNR